MNEQDAARYRELREIGIVNGSVLLRGEALDAFIDHRIDERRTEKADDDEQPKDAA